MSEGLVQIGLSSNMACFDLHLCFKLGALLNQAVCRSVFHATALPYSKAMASPPPLRPLPCFQGGEVVELHGFDGAQSHLNGELAYVLSRVRFDDDVEVYMVRGEFVTGAINVEHLRLRLPPRQCSGPCLRGRTPRFFCPACGSPLELLDTDARRIAEGLDAGFLVIHECEATVLVTINRHGYPKLTFPTPRFVMVQTMFPLDQLPNYADAETQENAAYEVHRHSRAPELPATLRDAILRSAPVRAARLLQRARSGDTPTASTPRSGVYPIDAFALEVGLRVMMAWPRQHPRNPVALRGSWPGDVACPLCGEVCVLTGLSLAPGRWSGTFGCVADPDHNPLSGTLVKHYMFGVYQSTMAFVIDF